MQRRDFREKSQPLVMIIPMIDIMLFLLVFFMISTIYMVQTNNFQVNLPQAETQQKNETTPPETVSVTVMVDGNILYNDKVISNSQLGKEIQQKTLENPDTVFIILGDKSARYEKVVAVLELLKKSGVKHVSIATETRK